jgi:hypothetical protein
MMTIDIDEQTHSRLETKARKRGLALPDYLKWIAENSDSDPLAFLSDDAGQLELRRRAVALAESAASIVPQPNRPNGIGGEFADAMFEKYRGK